MEIINSLIIFIELINWAFIQGIVHTILCNIEVCKLETQILVDVHYRQKTIT